MPSDFLEALFNARARGDAQKLELQRMQMQKDQFSQQLGLQRDQFNAQQSTANLARTDRLAEQETQDKFQTMMGMANGTIQPAIHSQMNSGLPILADTPQRYGTPDANGLPQPDNSMSNVLGLSPGPTVAPAAEMRMGGNNVTFVSPEHRAAVAQQNFVDQLRLQAGVQQDTKNTELQNQLANLGKLNLPQAVHNRAAAKIVAGGAIDYPATFDEAAIDAMHSGDMDSAAKFWNLRKQEISMQNQMHWTPAMTSTANSNAADAEIGNIEIPTDPKKRLELGQALIQRVQQMKALNGDPAVIGKLLQKAATLIPSSGGTPNFLIENNITMPGK